MKLSNIALALFAVPAAFASLAVRDPTPVEVAELSARAASPAVDSEQNLDERTLGLLLGGLNWWLDNFTNGRCNDGNKIVECARQDMCVWNNQCSYKNKPVYPGGSLWKYKCSSTAVLKCWTQNKGCRSDCVCEDVVTPPPVPTVTPTQPACSKLQVLKCACRGLAVRPDCGCSSCSCSQQSLCQRQKGTLDHSTCKCIYPSQTWRRRDLQPDNLCPKPQTACRLDALSTGWDGKFECVDTSSNLESCGGCATEGLGQDCTAIEGAADVACVSGKCVVSSCQKGFKVADGTCVPVSTGSQKVMGSPVWSA